MSESLSLLTAYADRPDNLFALLHRYRVVVPAFQRQYVQGADNPKAREVRENFVKSLLAASADRKLHLHFIYGPINTEGEDAFTPVDGQQRLTTLWLLARYAVERLAPEADGDRKGVLKLLARFSYAGRMHAERFCQALTLEENKWDTGKTPSESICRQDWFWPAWKEDETVDSMLRMLDTIHVQLAGDPRNVLEALHTNITFSLQIDSFADDIYMKMNARGLQLTPWENFKGRFSELLKDDGKTRGSWDSEIEKLSDTYFVMAGKKLPDKPFYALFARLLVAEIKNQEQSPCKDSSDSDVHFPQLEELARCTDLTKELPFIPFNAFAGALHKIGEMNFAKSFLLFLWFVLKEKIAAEVSPYWDSERTLLSSVFHPENQKEVDLAWLVFAYLRKHLETPLLENLKDEQIRELAEKFHLALRCMWNILENTSDGSDRCKEFDKHFIQQGGVTLYEMKTIPSGSNHQWKEELVKGDIYRSEDPKLIEPMQKAESWMHGRVRLGILDMTSDEHEANFCLKQLDQIDKLFKAWYDDQSDGQVRKTIVMNLIAVLPYWDDNFDDKEWNIPISTLDGNLLTMLTLDWIERLLQNNLCEVSTDEIQAQPLKEYDRNHFAEGEWQGLASNLDWRLNLLHIARREDGYDVYQDFIWNRTLGLKCCGIPFFALYKSTVSDALPIGDWRILLGIKGNPICEWYHKDFRETLKEFNVKIDEDITCNDDGTHSFNLGSGRMLYLYPHRIEFRKYLGDKEFNQSYFSIESLDDTKKINGKIQESLKLFGDD